MKSLKKRTLVIVCALLLGSFLLVWFAYRVASIRPIAHVLPSPTVRPVQTTPTFVPSPTPTPRANPSASTAAPVMLPLATNPRTILGVAIDGGPQDSYPGVPWVRLAYPTCGNGNYSGKHLQSTIQGYHQRGIYVLLITCQTSSSGPALFNTQQLNDVARGGADAVQCGNEEMKHDPNVRYVDPTDFARYYDLCEHAVHAVRQGVPVLLGALDPHVGGIDYQPLLGQVSYLDSVQYAMNTYVHPGGNWSWRAQTMGLIDSWHNGYPSQYVNSLYGLFSFWAQQFNVDLNSGDLGKHIWVVEGTGCFKGCGIDPSSSYQVAVSHLLTLITDVQTTMRYGVPFFYFSDRDFMLDGIIWPMGILDINGHAKPIRQDLPMGARTLRLNCATGAVTVVSQEQLLAKLYNGCTFQGDFISVIIS
jgi:hypothetical protein